MEDKTKSKNTILVTVEDPNDNMKNIKNKIKEAEKIKLIKDNKDGTKQYAVISDTQYDLRKKLFDVLPKEQIVIFELKKAGIIDFSWQKYEKRKHNRRNLVK